MLGLLTCASISQAQPDINNGAKAENPANRNRRIRPNKVEMTPEQRAIARVQRQLQALGTPDAATEETIAKYVAVELTAREPLLEKGQQLAAGLKTEALSDAQVAALLNDYQAAVEENRERHLKAVAALKKAVDFSKMPKVEALLTVLGIYGEGPSILNSSMGFSKKEMLKDRTKPARPDGAPAAPQTAPAKA
jgi:hypothetical protein